MGFCIQLVSAINHNKNFLVRMGADEEVFIELSLFPLAAGFIREEWVEPVRVVFFRPAHMVQNRPFLFSVRLTGMMFTFWWCDLSTSHTPSAKAIVIMVRHI